MVKRRSTFKGAKWNPELSDLLEAAREAASSPTYKSLAASIGVSEPTVHNLMSGRQFVSWEVTLRLAVLLGADVETTFRLWQARPSPRRVNRDGPRYMSIEDAEAFHADLRAIQDLLRERRTEPNG